MSRLVHLLLVAAFVAGPCVPLGLADAWAASADAKGAAHVAIRAPGAHHSSVARLKEGGARFVACGVAPQRVMLAPPTAPEFAPRPRAPKRVRDGGRRAPLASRPPPLA